MKKSVIIIARNEKDWPRITGKNWNDQFPGIEVIGVDDGGENEWHGKTHVLKTEGGIGVGMAKRLALAHSTGDLIATSDAHVVFCRGNKEKAWDLAQQGYVVTFYTRSLESGNKFGNGVRFDTNDYKISYCHVPDGSQIGLIGSVYMMKKEIAWDLIAPTRSHGYWERIMTIGALALGYPIYAMSDTGFRHLYKIKKFNYPLSLRQQEANRGLLEWWFLGGGKPDNATAEQQDYYDRIQEKRLYNPKQIIEMLATL